MQCLSLLLNVPVPWLRGCVVKKEFQTDLIMVQRQDLNPVTIRHWWKQYFIRLYVQCV